MKTRYDKIGRFKSFSNKRIEFFVVCSNAMQMFSNSVQSESILILGKFSPAERGGREQRGNLGYGEKLKVKGEMGERVKVRWGKG